MLKKLETLSNDIKYIVESKPHRVGFIYDFAHNEAVTEGSISEGLTACAAEDQGFIKKMIRAQENGADFLDETASKWDIKDAASVRPGITKYKFNTEQLLEGIVDSLEKQENVIVDITQLHEIDLINLTTQIHEKTNGLYDGLHVLYVHRKNSFASKFIKR